MATKQQFAKTLSLFSDRRSPTNIARHHREVRFHAIPEERIEITDPVLERHAVRVGWEMSERLGFRAGGQVRFVIARAIYRILDLDQDNDDSAVFDLTRVKKDESCACRRTSPAVRFMDIECEELRVWSCRHLLCVSPDAECLLPDQPPRG